MGGKVSSITYNAVEIGDNVFIGARTIVLPGTIIGDNTIIGAGSVIKGQIKSNSVYAGNPARYICSIDDYLSHHHELLK